ncbi:hypothetical protein SGQ83_07175 [Flavobacterium sp. Fl-318]|jgi:hypothetical protein|uniref:Uncharacterized protein n=1 Tax=Flavobacterium cupriresistens TaxID=2893885 RepID=A0ABU4R982_9FLAO|nr:MULTISPECIES: hypothetical protein [unclassified Flavobacterium]MDX6189122.1 hypothetical protein [Flavobacterium sp. Fl-318]UFH41219.1 hypothetical protein LNP23_15545 [Flavobacterium sp. F-323]
MKKISLLFLFFSLAGYSQTNLFTGTWSNENCKDCSKKYILNLILAQSNSNIFGTAEIINNDEKRNTGIMEVTGFVYPLGEKAIVKLKGKNGIGASIILDVSDKNIQFTKRAGSDLIPQETILTKLYD